MSKSLVVTGSSGLIGSEVVAYFAEMGRRVYGIDNQHALSLLWYIGRHAVEPGPACREIQ
jgi:nucleoside-diphosphate-sugar epimerase